MNKHSNFALIVLLSMILSRLLSADVAERGDLEQIEEPLVLPDPLESGKTIEPEGTTIERQRRVLHEYRSNGHLYMVKVFSLVDEAYFLLDQDGDGRMESRLGDIYNNTVVPQWELFRW